MRDGRALSGMALFRNGKACLLSAHQLLAKVRYGNDGFFYTLGELARRCLQPRAAAAMYARLSSKSALFVLLLKRCFYPFG